MKKTLRTFAAVEITGPIRARTEQMISELVGTSADVNWVEPHNLHITLKFLGNVNQNEITGVCRAVARGVAGLKPFDIEVRGAGAFPNIARPRTVWIGVTQGNDAMVVLHDRIEAQLAELGYREEHRRFQPHITIGRVRGAGIGIAELGEELKERTDYLAGRMTVSRVTLFSSELTPDGPIYDVIGTSSLGG